MNKHPLPVISPNVLGGNTLSNISFLGRLGLPFAQGTQTIGVKKEIPAISCQTKNKEAIWERNLQLCPFCHTSSSRS